MKHSLKGPLLVSIPPLSICPRHSDILDPHTSRLGAAETNVVPVVTELNSWLSCRHQREDVFLEPTDRTFKPRHIRHHATGVEMFEPVEDQIFTFDRDGQI